MRLFLKSFNIRSYENFEPTGEIICSKTQNIFLGANGAGKTQLLNLLGAMVNFNFSKVSDKKLAVQYILSLDTEEKDQNFEFLCDININPATQSIESNSSTIESVTDGLQKNNKAKEITATIEFRNNSEKLILFKVENGYISCENLEKRKEDVRDVRNADFSGYIENIISDYSDGDSIPKSVKNALFVFNFNIDWLQIHRFSEKDEEFLIITSTDKSEKDKIKFKNHNGKANIAYSPINLNPVVSAFVLLRYFRYFEDNSPDDLFEKKHIFENDFNNFLFKINFRKILSALNAKNIKIGFDKVSKIKRENLKNEEIFDYEILGITGEIEFNTGSTFDWNWLTFGQKRFITQAILFEMKKDCPLIIDEISNGYHPKLLMELLRLIENYQSFISSHNCMVLDAMPFVSSEELIRGVYIIKRDDNGKQTIKKFSDIQAKDIFEKAEVGIMNISQILEAEKIW